MARFPWDKEEELANANMMIANTRGQGGSPGQLWDNPDRNPKPGEAVFGVEKGGQTFFEFLKALGLDKNDKIAGISEFDTFMQNMRRGNPDPKSGSINHHPPHIQKIILGIGERLRAQAPANNIRDLGLWRTYNLPAGRGKGLKDRHTNETMEDYRNRGLL